MGSGGKDVHIPSRNLDKSLLNVFWKLVETDPEVRIEACISAIRILRRKQQLFEQENQTDEKCPELSYTIERLVRGMSSCRKAARQGYSVLLTELLRTFTIIQVEEILGLIEKHLPICIKQEKCQMVIGQLMAYCSLARFEYLKDSPHLSLVILNLYNLCHTRSYIQPASYQLIADLFPQLCQERFKQNVWPYLKKHLSCGWEKANANSLAWLLCILKNFPKTVTPKYLSKHWGSEDLLSDGNLSHWKKLVKESRVVHPQFHPVCDEFLDLCVQRKSFKEIWISVVDENLFETDQNEKTYLGFHMVKLALNKTNKRKIVKTVMSPKFCSVFHRSYFYTKHPFNSAATAMATFLSEYVKKSQNPQIQVLILKLLILTPGTVPMAHILKKKEVTLAISYLLPEAVKEFCEILKFLIFQKSEDNAGDNESDEGTEDYKKHYAVIQIGTLVSHPAIIPDTEWRTEVVRFLFLHSYFSVMASSENLPECQYVTEYFPVSLRQTFSNSFTKAADSVYQKVEVLKSDLLQSLMNYAESLLGVTEFVKPLFPADEVNHSWVQVKKILKQLKKHIKKGVNTKECEAFKVLFLYLGLQLFQDTKTIPRVLEELQVCYSKSLDIKPTDEEANITDDEEGPPWIQVLVDILLSLDSQSSRHMRNVISTVFPLFCPFITTTALQLILDVINPEKTEDSVLQDESDDDDDVEFKSGTSSDVEEESNEANNDGDANSEFKSKLQQVLGYAADVSNASEDSDVVLTDSEMFKLDDALSEAFRNRKKTGHSRMTPEQKTIMNFKMRCLDLIMAYLKTNPSMNMVIQCIKPVLAACEVGNQSKQQLLLGTKALNVFKFIPKARKFQNFDDVQVTDIKNIFKFLIGKAHKEARPTVAKPLYSLCVFMVFCERKLKSHLLLAESVSELKEEDITSNNLKCVSLYATALQGFVEEHNSHITSQMFLTFMNSYPEYAWSFAKPLENYAFSESVRLYKRSQCLGLIQSVLRFSKGQKAVTEDMWIQYSESLVPKIIDALSAVVNTSDIKPMFATELLDLLVTLDSICRTKTNKSLIGNLSGLLPLLLSMTDVQCKKLGKKGKNIRRKLVILLGGKLPTGLSQKTKRKVEDEKEDERSMNEDSAQNNGKNEDISEPPETSPLNGHVSSSLSDSDESDS